MPDICYTYIHVRIKLNYAVVAGLGFFVPYFDRDVILLPTPPCIWLAKTSVQFVMCYAPNPALLEPDGISHQGNPAHALLVP